MAQAVVLGLIEIQVVARKAVPDLAVEAVEEKERDVKNKTVLVNY